MVARPGSYIAVTSRLLNNSTFLAFNECLDYTGVDKIPHVEIHHRARCLPMEAIIAERQLRWACHSNAGKPTAVTCAKRGDGHLLADS